jgi:hypothetical protein
MLVCEESSLVGARAIVGAEASIKVFLIEKGPSPASVRVLILN